ncbi:MAG: hypothetical protein H7840_09285 [Alphaproteobacteria bacterium]
MTRSARRHILGVTGTVLLAALTACSSSGEKKRTAPLVCPHVAIDRATATLTRFREGPGRDITDVELEGEIIGFDGDCAFSPTGSGVDVTLMVRMSATRGPAARDPYAEVEYFVAVTTAPPPPKSPDGSPQPPDQTQDRRILNKEVFKVGTSFPPGINTVRYRDEEIELKIPIPPETSAAAYEVFVGYQLTRDQLDYNRSHPK